jgi:hypothetical protein
MGPRRTGSEFLFNQEDIPILSGKSFLVRILFYTCLKAAIRGFPDLQRNPDDWNPVFSKQLTALVERAEMLRDLREREERGHLDDRGIFIFPGSYSAGCNRPPVSAQDLFGDEIIYSFRCNAATCE